MGSKFKKPQHEWRWISALAVCTVYLRDSIPFLFLPFPHICVQFKPLECPEVKTQYLTLATSSGSCDQLLQPLFLPLPGPTEEAVTQHVHPQPTGENDSQY